MSKTTVKTSKVPQISRRVRDQHTRGAEHKRNCAQRAGRTHSKTTAPGACACVCCVCPYNRPAASLAGFVCLRIRRGDHLAVSGEHRHVVRGRGRLARFAHRQCEPGGLRAVGELVQAVDHAAGRPCNTHTHTPMQSSVSPPDRFECRHETTRLVARLRVCSPAVPEVSVKARSEPPPVETAADQVAFGPLIVMLVGPKFTSHSPGA